MLDRPGPMLVALMALSLCISIWRIALLEPPPSVPMQSQQQQPSPHQRPSDHQPYDYAQVTTAALPKQPISDAPLVQSLPSPNVATTPQFTISPTLGEAESLVDFNKLIDLDSFDFQMNQPKCDPNTMLLILIHSAPSNWHKRSVIRSTWGREDTRSRLIFLLGTVNSTRYQAKIEHENLVFNDLVQGSFVDAYRNMTYKHVMALKWFVYYCPQAQYILKTDDDVYVNTPIVFDHLNANLTGPNLLFCARSEGSLIKRSFRSKWRVSPREYPGKYYPPYCPGFSIIYSSDMALKLYKEAQGTPYFWIDDVHMTGTLTKKLDIYISPLGNYYLDKISREQLFNGKLNATDVTFLFTEPNMTEEEIITLWRLMTGSTASTFHPNFIR